MKRIISLTLIILILITLASCSGKEEKDTGSTIKVYRTTYDGITFEAVKIFKSEKKVQIDEVVFSDMQTYYDQVSNELLNGGGPDIVLIDPLFPGTEKLIEKGVFLDITKLTDDKVLSSCNRKVLDGMLIDNKRFLLPICYTTNTLVALKKTIDSTKLDVKDNMISLKSLVEMSDKATGNNEKPSVMDSSPTFSDFLLSSGINGTAICSEAGGLDDKVFTSLLNTYKTLTKGMSKDSGDSRQLLLDKKCTFANTKDALNPSGLLKSYSEDKYGSNEIVPINIASDKGEVYAVPQLLVGINKICKSPEAAIEFINILLDKRVQSLDGFMYTPVNTEAYDTKLKAYGKSGKASKLADNIQSLQEDITGSAYISFDIQRLLNEKAKAFKEGKMSAEVTIADIRNSVKNIKNQAPATSTGNSAGSSTTGETDISFDIEQKDHLKMYIHHQTSEAADAVRKYNLFSMGTQIDLETTKLDEEFTNKFTTSMLAGDGPDIIVARLRLVPSINSIAKSGAFLDLNTLMSNDPEMKPDDFYQTVMDSGVIDSKRYFIPYRFVMPALVSTDEVLKKNSIQIDENNWTWDKVLDIANQIKKDNSQDKKFLFDKLAFKDMLNSSEPFYSFGKKTTNFDSKEFIKLLNTYKQIYPLVCTTDEYTKYGSEFNFLQSGIGIFHNVKASYSEACKYHTIYQRSTKQEAQFYHMPTNINKNQTAAESYEIIGINSACKNKEDAYKFLKLFINKCLTDPLWSSIPCRKASCADLKNHYISQGAEAGSLMDDSGQSIPVLPILESHIKQLDNWIDNIKRCNIPDTSVDNIIDEQVKKFLLGQQTAEQTAKVIDQKVKLFLNE